MSTISTIYDTLVTRVSTVLPTHNRLPNPYTVAENPEPALNKGWGLQMSAAENGPKRVNCHLAISRNFTIVITRKFYGSELDTTSKATTEKDLMEDHFLVVRDLEQNASLLDLVSKAEYVSDSGIEFVFVNDKPFYKIESVINVQYIEAI